MTGPPPSSRLALEVALLAESTGAAAEPAPAAGARLVLVAAADADLRDYVRECLRARADVRTVEATALPHLVIADRAEGHRSVPLLLLLAEEPAAVAPPARPARAAPIEVLTAPFNARQLLHAVERLLGPPA